MPCCVPAAKASLKEKLEAYKAQAAGMGNAGTDKIKGKEETVIRISQKFDCKTVSKIIKYE